MHFTISGARNIVRFTEDFAVWRFVIIIEVPLRINEITVLFQFWNTIQLSNVDTNLFYLALFLVKYS